MRILVLSTTLTRQRAGTAHATVDIANGLAKITEAEVAVAAYEIEGDWLSPDVQVLKYEQAPNRRFFWRFDDVLAIDRCCRSFASCDFSGFDLCYVRNNAEALAFRRLYPETPLITHTGAVIAGKELLAERSGGSRFLLAANAAGRDYWEKSSYRQANWRHIVSTRLVASQRSKAFKLPDDFFYICPLPVDERAFNRQAVVRDVRAELGIPTEAPVMLTVSRLRKWKHIDAALRAFALCDPDLSAHYIVAGDGPERDALQQLAVDSGIEDRVHLVGHQSDPVPYYAAADLFVLPSTIESFGLVYAEAMHMGVPCIGLANNPPKSLSAAQDVIPADAGCCVTDGEELFSAMERYLLDPELRASHGAAAQAYALEEYSVANYVAFLAKVADEAFDLNVPFRSTSDSRPPVANQ